MCRSIPHLVMALLLLGAAADGSPAAAQTSGTELVSVKALPSVEAVHPGESFLMVFQFEIEPHWHIYWRNPGDTGVATSIEIDAPTGWTVGEIRWSRPQTFPGTFISYGYEDAATLFVPIQSPGQLTTGTANFKAVIDWLVCNDICLMGSAEKTITVRTAAGTPIASPEHGRPQDDPIVMPSYSFDDPGLLQAFRQLPRPARNVSSGIAIMRQGDSFVITGPARGFRTAEYLPNHTPGVSTTVTDLTVSPETDAFRLVLATRIDPDNTLGVAPVAGGVVLLGSQRTDPSYRITLPLAGETEAAPTDYSGGGGEGGGESH